MGQNPSTTKVIFALGFFQSLNLTGVFKFARVSTLLFERKKIYVRVVFFSGVFARGQLNFI